MFNGAFVPLVYLFYPETAGRTLEDIDRYFMEHSNILVFRDKVSRSYTISGRDKLTHSNQTATSAKRPLEYIEHEETQVRRHSSVNARAASMAVERYGERMSVTGQADGDEKEKGVHEETV